MSFKVTRKNIFHILKKAKDALDQQNVEYPRRFWTPFGGGEIGLEGKIVWDRWKEPIRVITKNEI